MTPEEQLKKNQRALNKAMRELDRERAKMEQQEKKIIADIKKMAKQGQMDAVKIMAKVSKCLINSEREQFSVQDLVRTRRYVKKFMLMRANIQAVSLKIQTLKSQNAMAQVENELILPFSKIKIIILISGYEGRHQGHDEYEQTDEAARDPEDHAGV